jgi:hypothetical protein
MANSALRRVDGRRLTLEALVAKGGGGASQLVADDFFEASAGPTYFGILKRWTGAAWIKEPLKRWTGSAWIAATLKRWTGTAWVTVDATGV